MLRISVVLSLLIIAGMFSISSVGAESVFDYMVEDLGQARNKAQESAACATLATIAAAAESYNVTNDEYPEGLDILAQAKPPYIDSSTATGEKYGYVFEYAVGANKDRFTCVARPVMNKFNMKKFMIDQEGNITEFGDQKQ